MHLLFSEGGSDHREDPTRGMRWEDACPFLGRSFSHQSCRLLVPYSPWIMIIETQEIKKGMEITIISLPYILFIICFTFWSFMVISIPVRLLLSPFHAPVLLSLFLCLRSSLTPFPTRRRRLREEHRKERTTVASERMTVGRTEGDKNPKGNKESWKSREMS